jgi:hypothetical protein
VRLPGHPVLHGGELAEVCFTTWPHPVPAEGTVITVTQYGEERDFRVVRVSEDAPYSLRLELEPLGREM